MKFVTRNINKTIYVKYYLHDDDLHLLWDLNPSQN